MLLSISRDAKTVKGQAYGVLTGILYLAPHTISGYQTCPKSTPECRAVCLYKAGMGVFNNVQKSRIARTHKFFQSKNQFMCELFENLQSLVRKANKNGLIPAVRLNGTSDIAWEKIAFNYNNVQYSSIIEAFPNIQFYDYTKILGRTKALKMPNYHLTFSLSEQNDMEALTALEQGYNVAVVMHLKRNESIPNTWSGFKTIYGDEHDARFFDAKGNHIVVLRGKGKAHTLKAGGFIRPKDGTFNILSSKKAA